MRSIFIVLIIVLSSIRLEAQFSGIAISGGFGTYQLNDLKLFQDELIAISPADAKGFTYFPPFTHIRLQMPGLTNSGLKYSFSYSFSTTGAHANYSDYSGNLNIDQSVTLYQAGATLFYPLLLKEYYEINLYGSAFFGYTRDRITRRISTLYVQEDYGVRLRAFSPSAEAGFEALYHLSKYSLGFEAGYQLDLGGKLRYSDNDTSLAEYLLPQREVRSNMSGVRVAAKIILRFNNATSF